MKKIIFILIIGLMGSPVGAQKLKTSEVPDIVKNSLLSQFPGASEIKWERGDGFYEAEFDLNEVDYSVVINDAGNVMVTEVEIDPNQLPAGILPYVKSNFGDRKIKETSKITDADGTVTYEVELKGHDLIFDSNGNFLKSESE
jgi:hypothetical protein